METPGRVEPIQDSESAQPPVAARSARRVLLILSQLGKLRLTALVVVATGAAFVLAHEGYFFPAGAFLATLAGTALTSAAASALNQLAEERYDRRMARTRRRPLPEGTVTPGAVLWGGSMAGLAGLSILCGGANSLAALLALVSLLLYVLVYTPLKRRLVQNTLIGAVPGAMPPLIGWAGAAGELGPGAWVLFATLFAWQIPHFLAIAWLYREDYAAAGFRMLPVADPSGIRTGRVALVYTLALFPISLSAPLVGLGGWFYAIATLVLTGAFLISVLRFVLEPTDARARTVFVASILWLPALLALLILDPPLLVRGW